MITKMQSWLGLAIISLAMILLFQNCEQKLKPNSRFANNSSSQPENNNNLPDTPKQEDDTTQSKPDCRLELNTPCLYNVADLQLIDNEASLLIFDSGSNSIFQQNLTTGTRIKLMEIPQKYGLAVNANFGVMSADESKYFLPVMFRDPLEADPVEAENFEILEIDLEQKTHRVVTSSNDSSQGSRFYFGTQIHLSPSGDSLFFAYEFPGKIIEVNIATGLRTVLYDDGIQANPRLFSSISILSASEFLVRYFDSGEDAVVLSVVDTTNDTRTILAGGSIGSGEDITNLNNIYINQDSTKGYSYATTRKLIELDLTNGNRSELWVAAKDGPLDKDFDTQILSHNQGGSKLVLSSRFDDQIYRINTETVTYAKIADSKIGYGPKYGLGYTPNSFGYLNNSNAILITDPTKTQILKIDLDSSLRTELAKDGDNLGVNLGYVADIVVSQDDTTAYIASVFNYLIKMDLTTGQRVFFSSWDETEPIGEGPQIFAANGLTLNRAETHVYVSDQNTAGIYKVEIATGDREVLTDRDTGSGPEILVSAYILSVNDDDSEVYYLNATSTNNDTQATIGALNIDTGVRRTILASATIPPMMDETGRYYYFKNQAGQQIEFDLWTETETTIDPSSIGELVTIDAKAGVYIRRNFVENTDTIFSY